MSVLMLNEDFLEAATRTVSSEEAAFPASNLYDRSQRGKVWRSKGYFLITSANKGIVFQETSGVNLTANIVEGEYTSLTTFLTAVKAALEVAGASTYTVTQNNTSKKINILSDLLGGGNVFKLMWTNVASTAYDVLGYDNAADDTGASNYTADEIRIHTSEWFVWDLGMSSNPDVFVAIGRKNDAIKLTPNATIRLQGNTTNSFSAPVYDQVITYDEFSLIKLKADGASGLHSIALRYWKLNIVDNDNPSGYLELSNVYLGEWYETTQGDAQFPFGVSIVDFSAEKRFDSGSSSFNRRERSQKYSFDWLGLTTTEKEIFEALYLDVGVSKYFFVIFDKDIAFSSSVNFSARYVRFSSAPNMRLITPGVWSSSWDLEELI